MLYLVKLAILGCGVLLHPDDTLSTAGAVVSDRKVELNAESATVPREINIGLPETGRGAVVWIDGTMSGLGLPRSHYHWAGGNSYLRQGSMSLMESVIKAGEIAVLVDSYTRTGGDDLSLAVTAGSSSNGLIRFDGAVNGPLGNRGGYFSTGVYLNLDPTCTPAPSCPFVDRKAIFQGSLSKAWKGQRVDFIYRFSWCGDQVERMYSAAPFVYEGDGSISLFNGFKIGRDNYFPADDRVHYMDLVTGKTVETRVSDLNDRRIHDISIRYTNEDVSGWKLNADFHACLAPEMMSNLAALAGTDKVSAADGYTLEDGTPVSGYIQNRMIRAVDVRTYDFTASFVASKKTQRHSIRLGAQLLYANQYEAGSTFIMAHTAGANPDRVFSGGRDTWRFNTGALFFKGHRFGLPLYVIDDWHPSGQLLIRTGLRLRPMYLDLLTAARMGDDTRNRRVDGFNLSDASLARLHPLKKGGVDYAVSEHLSYRLAKNFFAVAEGFYSITNKNSTYYCNATIPSTNPIGNALIQGGLTLYGQSFNLSLSGFYITSWNNAKIITVTRQIAGQSETIPWTAQYGIGTAGVTLENNYFKGGFKLHSLVTFQDPRYKNYTNLFTFSDGSTQEIDYTGNFVTGISRVMFELDPSYSFDKWRIWLSARYYSRRYASRTNYAYFNDRVETFAGVDREIIKGLKMSLSLINPLFQHGIQGSIDIADTIDDPSQLEGYVMAGAYIRPFTAELSVSYRF